MLLTRGEICVGSWYRLPGGEDFEVVAADHERGLLEVQYFDGTIEEMDLDTCLLQGIQAVAAPGDWTGSVDVEQDLFDAPGEHVDNWEGAMEMLERQEGF